MTMREPDQHINSPRKSSTDFIPNILKKPFKRENSGSTDAPADAMVQAKLLPKDQSCTADSPRKSSTDFIPTLLKMPFSKKYRRNGSGSKDSTVTHASMNTDISTDDVSNENSELTIMGSDPPEYRPHTPEAG
jgi:hypothetical protein